MNTLPFVFAPSSSLRQQMDTSVHLEKPYQVEAIGPPYASFDIVLQEQRFWGRNASHMELTICFKYSLKFTLLLTYSITTTTTGHRMVRWEEDPPFARTSFILICLNKINI